LLHGHQFDYKETLLRRAVGDIVLERGQERSLGERKMSAGQTMGDDVTRM
jgi:hypothetical protein